VVVAVVQAKAMNHRMTTLAALVRQPGTAALAVEVAMGLTAEVLLLAGWSLATTMSHWLAVVARVVLLLVLVQRSVTAFQHVVKVRHSVKATTLLQVHLLLILPTTT